MSFLRVNGWALPVADSSVSEAHDLGGDFSRSFSGSLLSDERYDKRVWSGQTAPVTEMVAEAIKGIVRGLGHVWSWDSDLYSSKGLGVSGSTSAARRTAIAVDGSDIQDTHGPYYKYGDHSLSSDPAVTNLLAGNQRDGTEDTTTTGFTAYVG